jgi:two-component system LytT family response regulator
MPGLDGFAVVQQLPEPRPLIVFSTGFGAHAVRAFDHQALDYIVKPYDGRRLKITLDRARLALARRAAGE